MTVLEVIERATAVWGPTSVPLPSNDDGSWDITLPGRDERHQLDAAGHVACGHPDCLARERMAQRDALARKRVRLERVLQTRLGHADVINVMSPTRVQLGTLAATADAIAVTGVRAIRVERQGPDRLLILFDPAP
jgi:hypothetical protein